MADLTDDEIRLDHIRELREELCEALVELRSCREERDLLYEHFYRRAKQAEAEVERLRSTIGFNARDPLGQRIYALQRALDASRSEVERLRAERQNHPLVKHGPGGMLHRFEPEGCTGCAEEEYICRGCGCCPPVLCAGCARNPEA